ncbi:MAG: SDR family oxidoreductase [Acidobacteria bacterium]|jgi:3-oxoacyl-[acyl-carrier protein] reductase|nr:SDR family oxidoreductase [Acidobacteriota bacterium]
MSVQSVHQFAEKVALVSDGEGEIGRAVALQLALQGCYVIVGFSNANEQTKSTLAELQNLGTLAHVVETDCSTAAGARRLVAEAENIYGRLDLLVNTLKFRSDSTFDEMSESVWTKTLDANLKATFFVSQAAVKLMSARPKAKIVNVVYDCAGAEKDLAFALAQAGIISLTKNLAAQLEPKFRVNAVQLSEEKSKAIENLDRELFRPPSGIAFDDVARAVLFLLSSEAVGLNGQVLKIE